jgi:6-phosphogluconolactonase
VRDGDGGGVMEVQVLASKQLVAAAGAELLAAQDGTIALAGGSTPEDAYKLAARLRADWSATRLWLSDDRCVPADDPRSNSGMVERTLLARLQTGPAEWHPVPGELGPDAAADAYEATLPDAFDLVLVGLGPDAHTASLFPGKPAVGEQRRRVAPVPEPGMEPLVPRVTFTLPELNAAAHVVFLVAGADKAEAVRGAFGDPADPASPAAHVRPARLTVLLDEAAAAQL